MKWDRHYLRSSTCRASVHPSAVTSLTDTQIKVLPVEFVQFSCSVMSDSLQPHGLQHVRFPCPSPTPRVHPNPCPLCWCCHPTISSSVVPLSSCPQSFPASGSFQMSQFFTSGDQSISLDYCYLGNQKEGPWHNEIENRQIITAWKIVIKGKHKIDSELLLFILPCVGQTLRDKSSRGKTGSAPRG